MRRLMTGIDNNGQSCVLEESELPAGATPIDAQSLYRTRSGDLPARPNGHGELRDLGVRPGQVRWIVSRWAPDAHAGAVHHTDTIDLDLVIEGSITLLLDDGEHLLHEGDCVVIAGVDHAWRAGAAGCTLSVVLLGTPPPADPAPER